VSRQALFTAAVVACCASVEAGTPTETLKAPLFGTVSLYTPTGAPRAVVLFVSGDGGWNLGVVSMAETLRDRGALVAGIDIRTFTAGLESGKGCPYPAGALEELARSVELHRKMSAYKRPILVGYSSGATLVYAALAAAPAETFAGAVSLGFCSDWEIHREPCVARGLRPTKKAKGVGYDLAPFAALTVPWMILQGESDQVCAPAKTRAFVAETGHARLFSLSKVGHGFSVPRNWEAQFVEAFEAIVGTETEAAPVSAAAGVADLSLVEVPARGAERAALAVLLTGDGGWAEIDKSVADGLAAAGVPVVGWSSLSYYWTPRTPQAAADDLARIIAHYAEAWRKDRVLLVGYSFGADVLPFLVSRLPALTREHVAGVTLLGLSSTAAFEFHISSWLGGGGDGAHPTVPEVETLTVPVTCVVGDGEADSACSALRGPHVRRVVVGHGHHFGGDYERLAAVVVEQLR
jgi:type IV secretory pathway VirJ component